MKTKFLYLAAIAFLVSFTACEKQAPYDLQSPDDNPLILVPYEGDHGTAVNVGVTNPDPYVDSVIVVPSAYTTVNWYLDNVLVHTGNKINKAFPTGTYDLLIEAVTTAGKRTTRSGTLTVNAAKEDPYVSTRVLGKGMTMSMEGSNLDQVKKVILAMDFYGNDTVCTVDPTNLTVTKFDVMLPEEMANGTYYLCLKNNEDVIFGSGKLKVESTPMALSGFTPFTAGETWVITGVNLKNVVSVKVGDLVITELTATNTSVTLTAPNLPEGAYTMSMQTSDGSDVQFSTWLGLVTETNVRSSATEERTIWEGSCVIDWGTSTVHIGKSAMAEVPESAILFVYYNVPTAGYHSLQVVVAPDWSYNVLPQLDGMEWQPNPYKFIYDGASKSKVDADDKDGILITGFGLEITKLTYK